MKYVLFPLCCALLLCSACEKSTDWELVDQAPPVLVVEAILTDQDTIQEIRLSQSYADLNGTPPAVDDAVVSVSANGVAYFFTAQAATPGLYRSQAPFAVVDRLEYTLDVFWQGTRYTANSVPAAVAPMPEITFLPYQGGDSLRLGDFIPPYHPSQQAMYEIEIDWSHLAAAVPNRATLYGYTFRQIDVGQFGLPPREVVGFPRGSKVTVLKYGLNDEFAAYLRARAIETDWNGNFFYGTAENPPTNISSGGLGFFSTCAVLREEVVAE